MTITTLLFPDDDEHTRLYSHPAQRPDDGRRHRKRRPHSARAFALTDHALEQLEQNRDIIRHERFQRLLAAGDPDALAIKAAVDKWQLQNDVLYRAYWRRVGVPVAPARFRDLSYRLTDLYTDPIAHQTEIAAILAALGLSTL